jgi:hypothetical protein
MLNNKDTLDLIQEIAFYSNVLPEKDYDLRVEADGIYILYKGYRFYIKGCPARGLTCQEYHWQNSQDVDSLLGWFRHTAIKIADGIASKEDLM